MDVSKAFHSINQELLIAKLYEYGFFKIFLEIILIYLSHHYHCVKVNATFSSWAELSQGVPQDSVFGPILFNIYLNDSVSLLNIIDTSNFADDARKYVCDVNFS